MKNLRIIVPCIAVLLFGCSTPNQMREKTPDMEVTSSKPAQKVAACIANRWENLGVMGSTIPVNMKPTEDGYSVSWYNTTWEKTNIIADVKENKSGSVTRFYRAISMTERFEKAIKECQ
ncbi:MAG: hypothetical protein HQL10_09785 [Nitrospirae bacterium]|nr:hypothetical protein [Nitrospirota bacterium]